MKNKEIQYSMIKKIVNYFTLKPANPFLDLFVDAAQNVVIASDILAQLISNGNILEENKLASQLKYRNQRVGEIQRDVLSALNVYFITPIDRGDIQELSVLFLKLSKRIVRIHHRIKIYTIDSSVDSSLVGSVVSLQNMTKIILEFVCALKDGKYDNVSHGEEYLHYFDENELEDLRYAMKNIYTNKSDVLTILKLREVYMTVESAIEIARSIMELIIQIAIKVA